MKYPVNCNKCNQPLYGPVKFCPFCGVASVSMADIPAEKKPDIVKAEINTPLMQGEHAPEVREDISQEGKKIGSSDENKKVIDKTPQQPEPEINHKKVIAEQEKTSVQQKVGIDKASVPLPRDSGVSGQNYGGTIDGRKRKGKLVKVIAAAAVIILVVAGVFYYNNSNNKKIEPKTTSVDTGKANREDIDKYLAEGKSLFEKGKYRECSEIMNRVLQQNPNNSLAKWYVKEASKRIEKSTKLSDPAANTTSRRW